MTIQLKTQLHILGNMLTVFGQNQIILFLLFLLSLAKLGTLNLKGPFILAVTYTYTSALMRRKVRTCKMQYEPGHWGVV